MKSHMLKGTAFAALLAVTMIAAPAAFAQDAAPKDCKATLEALSKDYAATGLSAPAKPSQAMVHGTKGHTHTGAEMTVMKTHFAEAQRTCDEGKDHESMLHQDVVRAILNLPPVEHPASHHYTKPAQQ